jgi:hypothetical protein
MTSPGTGPGGDLTVDPAKLAAAAAILDTAAGSLSDSVPSLRRRPDAGASSDEVATALGVLAGAVTAIAEQVAASAESSRTSAADYTVTDQAVQGSMQQRGRSLVE